MPAGKAIAIAAMPTAVLMGMGFTPTLALAEDKPAAKSLTVDEYKDCVEALEEQTEEAKDDASASPTPSASTSTPADDEKEPSAVGPLGFGHVGLGLFVGFRFRRQARADAVRLGVQGARREDRADADALPLGVRVEEPARPPGTRRRDQGHLHRPTRRRRRPRRRPPPRRPAAAEKPAEKPADKAEDPVKDTVEKAEDTVKDVTDAATDAAEDTAEKAEDAADDATASPTPSPSASSTTDPDDCPAATDDEGGVEQGFPPWPTTPGTSRPVRCCSRAPTTRASSR